MFCSITRGAARSTGGVAALGTDDDDTDADDDDTDDDDADDEGGVGITDLASVAATAAAPSCNFRRLSTVFAASTTGFAD
jgi:hypothetical protein